MVSPPSGATSWRATYSVRILLWVLPPGWGEIRWYLQVAGFRLVIGLTAPYSGELLSLAGALPIFILGRADGTRHGGLVYVKIDRRVGVPTL